MFQNSRQFLLHVVKYIILSQKSKGHKKFQKEYYRNIFTIKAKQEKKTSQNFAAQSSERSDPSISAFPPFK